MKYVLLFVLHFFFWTIMKAHDLVDIQAINPSILLDIKYATSDNFTKKQVYQQAKAYLRKKVALQLDKVAEELKKQGLRIKIWDAYRPQSVQHLFWNLVPDERYVADPKKGSRHNRGAAVDVTLVDAQGKELLMPTAFDDFSEKAHRNYKNAPKEALKNRALLEKIMTKHGFEGLPTEWWHYDYTGWQKYDVLDISFEDLSKKS